MSRIIRVELARFDYTMVGEFKFFKPGPDGKSRRPTILVRLTDSDGHQGWGQAVPVPTWTYETPESVLSTLEFYLAEAILGADPADPADIHVRMNQAIRPAFSVGQPLCKAAIDLACYDLQGRATNQPVYALLGGSTQQSLTLSWTVASPNMAVVEQQLEEGRARGYHNFNIKVGAPQTPAYDLELAQRVRAFAPDSFLWADANTGYDLDTALEVLPKLAAAGVDVLEAPLPPSRIRGYQRLRRLGALPIFMDEGILSPVEVEEFIALEMLDGIAMKPARNAGIWPSWQIMRHLQDQGLQILGSGLTDPDLSLAAAVHLFAWAGISRPCALNGPQFLAEGLSGPTLQPQNDQLTVPTAPGLGLTLPSNIETQLRIVAEL